MVLNNPVKNVIQIGKMNGLKCLHIAMTGTGNYIPYIGIAISSVYESNLDLPIVFHLFLNDLSEAEEYRLEEVVDRYNGCIFIYIMDDNAFKKLISKDKPPVFFYRFIIADLLKDKADRVLYMDGDVFCNGSLKKLMEIEFGENIVGVVTDRGEKRQAKRSGVSRFFNAGVVLIDVKKWCDFEIAKKSIELSHKFLERAKRHRVRYDDQIILNIVLEGKKLFLPVKYNYLYNLSHGRIYQKDDVNQDYTEQVIVHFAGYVKPWHSWLEDDLAVQKYLSIKDQTPWKEFPLIEPTTHKLLHQAARYYRTRGEYTKSMNFYFKYLASKLI